MSLPTTAPPPQRGEIYWVDLTSGAVGSEQSGRRPALVISPTWINGNLPVVVVAAITTQIRSRSSPYVVILAAGQPLPSESAVLGFQVRTIDKTRLFDRVGTLTPQQQQSVDAAVAASFGIPRIVGVAPPAT